MPSLRIREYGTWYIVRREVRIGTAVRAKKKAPSFFKGGAREQRNFCILFGSYAFKMFPLLCTIIMLMPLGFRQILERYLRTI